MNDAAGILARAISDGNDRLLSAEEPLAGLQRRCGGEAEGMIAVPELLELVRQVRSYRFRLARAITAQDAGETISAWVEVAPRGDEEGCEIVLRSWQATPLPAEEPRSALDRRLALDRHVAELSARLDAGQRLLTVSSSGSELQALAQAMEAGIGRPFTDFIEPEASRRAQPLHWRMLDGAPVAVHGSMRDWRIVLIPLGTRGGEPTGFELLLVSDSGEALRPDPQASPEERSGGFGLIGQDLAPVLRQPLARIIANAETIRTRLAGPLPDAYADYASEIANAARLLMGLIEDLADLEVVESPNFATAPDHIDLAEVARQATGILGVRAREKRIALIAPALGETAEAVAEFRRVLQILINLVGNAIRYSPEGSQVWVRVEREGDRARVVVADQGPGLSPEQQQIVFRKFERLGRSGDGGSGLGLYISRQLALAMGGDLRIESAKGQGARFILEVPAEPANSPPHDPAG